MRSCEHERDTCAQEPGSVRKNSAVACFHREHRRSPATSEGLVSTKPAAPRPDRLALVSDATDVWRGSRRNAAQPAAPPGMHRAASASCPLPATILRSGLAATMALTRSAPATPTSLAFFSTRIFIVACNDSHVARKIGARIATGNGHGKPSEIIGPALVVTLALFQIGQAAMGEAHQCAAGLIDEIDLDQA